ncbi:MAG: hypothetical protein RIB45_13890 [Marivibrio sp.]|uniref:hypothetical protein n=1 Tax=Marivibrio sp. TaxID=2039719 RepID=UPI0032EE4722
MSTMATTADLIRTPSPQEIAAGIEAGRKARSEAFRRSFTALRLGLQNGLERGIVGGLSMQRHFIPRRAAHPCAG